ncbi:ABC transporter permease [Arthrobacter sp. MYb227]|uniref:ABC transporter permease n=1 Tax=Arthrobacter sp. MYb227 TaxID=1848601 RepID=UPI000CFDC759|nr:ABC transporter permease [Arthrobacter sp. MYb227]PQZ95158.1 ABC transporter permease [Arthrobacter sp. MYb227]
MNATYVRIELFRQSRDVMNLMFAVLMPVAMYVLFGNMFGQGSETFGNGNVKFYIMVSMAAYGSAVATTAIAGTAATEAMLGWGRQIALTPMKPAGFVACKIVVAMVVSSASALAVFLTGAATGARADEPWLWVASYAITVVGSGVFALYGMAAGLAFKSETAIGIASSGMVFFAFFGNVFMPLSGVLLDIAKFTPMYGFVGLARYPLTEGYLANDTGASDSWGLLMANLVAWILIFAGLALWAVRRSQARK